MKVHIDRDECHPYFICQDGQEGIWQIEMSEKELEEFRTVSHNYWAYQDLIDGRIHDRRRDVPNT